MPGPRSTAPSRVTLHVGALGKDGVEVRGDHEMRTRRRAGSLAQHVARLVDAHVLQPELLKDASAVRRRAPSSLNDGAGISQKRIWSSIVCASLAFACVERGLDRRDPSSGRPGVAVACATTPRARQAQAATAAAAAIAQLNSLFLPRSCRPPVNAANVRRNVSRESRPGRAAGSHKSKSPDSSDIDRDKDNFNFC